MHKTSLVGAIIAGAIASACCLGPLLLVSLGLGSASIFVAMEPYRPIFGIITLALLSWVVWQNWRASKQCTADECAPKSPIFLWLLGGIAILLLISPSFISYLI